VKNDWRRLPSSETRGLPLPRAREQRGRCRDRRGGADRDVARIADQSGDDIGEEFFGAEGR